MANSVDQDQSASYKSVDLDLHCLQRQGISGLSKTRVKVYEQINAYNKYFRERERERERERDLKHHNIYH